MHAATRGRAGGAEGHVSIMESELMMMAFAAEETKLVPNFR
jgi:hypothetical protein